MRKITVTLNGKQFSRRTARPYQFAIIGRLNYAQALERAQAGDVKAERKNYDFYCGAYYTERYLASDSPEERARVLAIRAMTFEEYHAEGRAHAVARVEARRAAGGYDMDVLGWTQVDPAKMFAKFQKDGCYLDMAIVPVGGVFPAPEVK